MSAFMGDAPWYEMSGMIRIPNVESFSWGYNGIATVIPLPFSFPIENTTVDKIYYSWGMIHFKPDDSRVQNDTEYEDKTYTLHCGSFGYGWFGEQVYYQTTPNYCRIKVMNFSSNSKGAIYEFIFFKNGDIQIKGSGDQSNGYTDDNNNYTSLYYQYKNTGDSSWSYQYLFADSIQMTSEESIYIVRSSGTSYTVSHSYYDISNDIPSPSKIISNLIISNGDNKSYFGNRYGVHYIPIYSTSEYNGNLRIKTNNGIGIIRTQTPVTPDLTNPPIYIYNNEKKQLSCGFSSTKEYIYQGFSLCSWGNLSNNLTAKNNSSYYWINPSYRYFDEAVSNVYEIQIRAGINYNSKITKILYVYYASSASDGLSSSNFTYLGNITTTGNSGEYKTINFSVSNVTVGAVMIVSGISGSNATSGTEFDSEIMLKVKNGLKLL